MSLNAAMQSAVSGLNTVSRATGLVADNITNASTPSYARRSLALASLGHGFSGVRGLGVIRHSNPVITAQRRDADAAVSQAEIRVAFYSSFTRATGGVDSDYSLTTRLADFEASLIAAASRPDLEVRLTSSVEQASDLAANLRAASENIQDQRQQSDRAIASMVDDLNIGLSRLEEINSQITNGLSNRTDVAGLQDERNAILDKINRIVPVTVVERPVGQIALYSQGGTLLLDGKAAELDFTQTGMIQADSSLANDTLSGLTLNGLNLRTGSSNGQLRGGALSAHFDLRDEWAVDAQMNLDAIAHDLIERFQDPNVDVTLGASDAGLFTDRQDPLDISRITGLAGRIEINSQLDSDAGGQNWRLRDGLGASTVGDPGNSSLIKNLQNALGEARLPSSGSLINEAQDFSSITEVFAARYQNSLARAEDAKSYSMTTQSEVLKSELAIGVDTDTELQSLMILEQNYAANAKVLETIDALLTDLLRI